MFSNNAPIADQFAQIEAEYNAIKAQYEDLKKKALAACMSAAGDDLKSIVDGDHFALHFSLTAVNKFSADKAIELGYWRKLTDAETNECKIGSTRQNLSAKARARVLA